MTGAKAHRLFQAFPLDGTVKTTVGELPKPYHVYEGHALLIAGTVDAAAVAEMIKDEDVHLVTTCSGKALMGIFVCDFTDASLGPHQELQLSVLVRERPGPPLSDTKVAYLAALASEPDMGTLCLHLWNDTKPVLAYNSEYLGLNAKMCRGEVLLQKDRLTFDFQDETGAPLVAGDVRQARFTGIKIMLETIRAMGLKAFFNAARQPWTSVDVFNRKGFGISKNRRAGTRSKPDKMTMQYVDARDRIKLTHPELSGFGFEPQCFQHLSPFRFVYLHPDAT